MWKWLWFIIHIYETVDSVGEHYYYDSLPTCMKLWTLWMYMTMFHDFLYEAVDSVSVHNYYSFSTLLHCVKLSDNKQII